MGFRCKLVTISYKTFFIKSTTAVTIILSAINDFKHLYWTMCYKKTINRNVDWELFGFYICKNKILIIFRVHRLQNHKHSSVFM